MGKRKTARKPQQTPDGPELRYVVVNVESNRPVYISDPRKKPDKTTWGCSKERAERLAAGLVEPAKAVPAWEYYNYPKPEVNDK